jgi:hypothetical protein
MPLDVESLCANSVEWAQITAQGTSWEDVTRHFTQIGEPFRMVDRIDCPAAANQSVLTAVLGGAGLATIGVITVAAAAGAVDGAGQAAGPVTITGLNTVNLVAPLTPATVTVTTVAHGVHLSALTGELTECLMNLTTFQLRFEVFEGLRQMYAEQPLIIPTNILHYSRFSGQPGGTNQFHATLSQSLENCDTVFILVPNNNNQTTCFYQPYLNAMRLSLGEFGIHPGNYVATYNDPRFIAMALDALNLETSEITAMNVDVARSLSSPRLFKSYTAGVNAGDPMVAADSWRYLPGDDSNFFIGISLSQVGFQSGTVSSPNTNIPFIFDAAINHNPRTGVNEPMDCSIIAMFLLDCALMIQVVPNSDIPVVKLTSKSIV